MNPSPGPAQRLPHGGWVDHVVLGVPDTAHGIEKGSVP